MVEVIVEVNVLNFQFFDTVCWMWKAGGTGKRKSGAQPANPNLPRKCPLQWCMWRLIIFELVVHCFRTTDGTACQLRHQMASMQLTVGVLY